MQREVIYEGKVIAKYIPGDNWPQNLSFYSADQDFIQVGTWRYDSGKALQAHVHKRCVREAEYTQEVIFVKNGELEADIYSEEGKLVESIRMRTGDCLILLAGGHGYRIINNDTQVLEIKNGPYFGPEKDRRRFSEQHS